jgi:hypothetical protein
VIRRKRFTIIENNLGLPLIGRNAKHDTRFTTDQPMFTQAGQIHRQDSYGARFAAASAYHADKFLNALQRLTLATAGELGEDFALRDGEDFPHSSDQQDAPRGPAITRKRIAEQLAIGESFPERDLRSHSAASA